VFRHTLPVLALLSVPTFAQDEKAPRPPGDTADVAKVTALIVDRTNDFRKAEKREPVKVNAELTKAAEYFARFMADTGKYGHEADDQKPSDRARKHGYDYCLVLENIAYQYSSEGFNTDDLATGLVKGWKESPGHRKNMLDPDVTETGVAVARSEKTGYYYAVQMFGRPKSAAIVFKVANQADVALEYTIGEEKFTLDPRYTQTHTRCRPSEVAFQAPTGLGTVKAGGAEKFNVTGSKGTYEVKKE
jgi:uncharacterized protein YkwD